MSRARVLSAVLALLFVVLLVLWRASEIRLAEAPPGPTAESGRNERPEVERPSPLLESARPSPEPAGRVEAASQPAIPAEAPEAREAWRTVTFLVTDPAERPLEGAHILVTLEQEDEPAAEARTGPDGRASVDLPPRARTFVAVEREGHVHVRDYLELAERTEVELPRAVRLHGRVLESGSRAPVAGARLWRNHDACRFCEQDVAESDALGRYELAGVPAASGFEAPRLFVSAEGYPGRSVALDTAGAGEVLEYDIALERGTPVAGRVLAFPARTPVEGARVSVGGGQGWTDALGRFELRTGEGAGEVTLEASARGFAAVRLELARAELDTELELLLPTTGTLEGTVRDGDGRPVAGAQVRAGVRYGEESHLRHGLLAPELGLPPGHRLAVSEDPVGAKADGEGRFRLEGLVPGVEIYLYFVCRGFEPLRETLPLRLTPGGTARHDVRLRALGATGAIRGRITLNGAPAKLQIGWKGPTRRGTTWAKGERYELSEVECGRVQLDVHLEARTHGLFAPVELTLEPGATVEHDLALELTLGRITGRLRRESGGPAVGVPVTALHEGHGLERHTESDAEGAYSFELPVVPRPYLVHVASAGEFQRRFDAVPDGPPVDFVLPDSAPLRVRVQDAGSGAVIDDCTLAWKRPGETSFRPASFFHPPDAEGWRQVELPLGPLELLVRADALGYRAARVSGLVAGDPGGSVVALERGTSVEVRLDPGGEPFPEDHALFLVEAEVAAQVSRQDPRQPRDPSGVYPFGLEPRRLRLVPGASAYVHGLGPGRHRFLVGPDDLVLEPGEIEVGSQAREPVLLRWRRR